MAFKIPDNNEDEFKSNDGLIIFDEKEHVYYYENKPLISVTQFIKEYTEPFNSLFASNSKVKKNIKNKEGISNPINLRKYWKLGSERSATLGTASHIFAQMYMLDRNTIPKTNYEIAIVNAIKKLEENWEIIVQENIVYSLEYMIAGSIDLILKNKTTNEYAVGDWKTTEDLIKYYDMLKEPFNIHDSALNKYSIQLDIYSILSSYNIPNKNRIIIKLNSDSSFEFYAPNNKNKNTILPYTLDKTKMALDIYKQQNKL